MARKRPGQRRKVLALRKILLEETDEKHPMPMTELQKRLEVQGLYGERKGVYTDISALRQEGLDVQYRGAAGWYINTRPFRLAELKILIDVVQASRFLTPRKSQQLVEKLSSLASSHEGEQLKRRVYMEQLPKAQNESIYYHVDKLHEAIHQRKMIQFQYFDYTREKEKKLRHNGALYAVSPKGLIWNHERYYLAAVDHRQGQLRHYRVDRMQDIVVTAQRQPPDDEVFDTAKHKAKLFEMFRGHPATVELFCQNDAAGLILDRFGMDVLLQPQGETHFSLVVSVELSPPFWGWLFMLQDKVRLQGPAWVRELYLEQLRSANEQA